MKRSIVPNGFSLVAHSIFHEFELPFKAVDIPAKRLRAYMKSSNENPSAKSDEYDTKCLICLKHSENPVTVISCTHSFCADCLALWFSIKLECPLCKSSGCHIIQNKDYASDQTIILWQVETPGSIKNIPDNLEAAIVAHERKFSKAEKAGDSHLLSSPQLLQIQPFSPKLPVEADSRNHEIHQILESVDKDISDTERELQALLDSSEVDIKSINQQIPS